jgi:hypothetical protein
VLKGCGLCRHKKPARFVLGCKATIGMDVAGKGMRGCMELQGGLGV